ncbi:superoxide dismutase copper/zinc binding protein [Paenibacillus mucilaginosus 3016]|uniref:Superoxide dismutase [Cu-Zn] n=2 Tax=Paenibacillus mucilaginosus TaxID=61624 RepID=H6NFL0_9BACL|nr:superoxide dismutase family protein [Paenibacillus mucilaginosus]AFC30096.1 superoxide dismutase copper/zinc binding protein [Paenibacillus mucilaginosus 3016]AFH62356.1 superoxide dismutase [Paenibacillus mucilaginosus K02]WFA18745.1 superoxide dismutase family protein [Paenibacillus mucilaginosus]
MKGYKSMGGLLAGMLLLSACSGPSAWFGLGGKTEHQHEPLHKNGSEAVMAYESKDAQEIDIIGIRGTSIGKAKLSQAPEGVRIQLDAAHLPPGPHGFHFHETGRCEAPDFKTAGAHFNPTGRKHGTENPQGPHAGDLPNIEADKNGMAKADFVMKGLTLEKGKPTSLLKEGGTSLVIHEKADDYKTDPSGNSGARIACGAVK